MNRLENLQVGAEVIILLGTKDAKTEGIIDGAIFGVAEGANDADGATLGVHDDSELIRIFNSLLLTACCTID